jgi:hypothetical protein
MSYHGALDVVNTWRDGLLIGSSSSVPNVTTVMSGRLLRRMNNCEPQRLQKHFRRLGDDSYSVNNPLVSSTLSLALSTTEFVEKAAP